MDSILTEVLASKTIDESFQYIRDIHHQILENKTESTSVNRSYKLFTESLHTKVLQKIIHRRQLLHPKNL